jgi:uncharacterized protein YraI
MFWSATMRASRTHAVAALLGLAAGFVPLTGAQAYPSGDPNVARTIYQVARSRGVATSSKVMLAMFEAAVTESGMRNLTYGDRDSVGVFQLRVGIWGWWRASSVVNSANWFLDRAIPRQNWYSTAGALAQAVEVSAYPYRYNQNEGWARAWISYVSGSYSPPSSTAAASFQAKVTASLNVRTGPGTGYSIVGLLSAGTVVNVNGTSGGWYRITYGGAYRWIYGAYTVKVASSPVLFQARVTASALNVRTGAGTGYSVVGSLGYGTIVNVYATSNNGSTGLTAGWYKILYGGSYRWIAGWYTQRV